MNFIKENLTLILMGLIALVVGGLEAFLAQSAKTSLEAVSADLAGKVQQQNHLVQTKPFPSDDNIKQIEKNEEMITRAAEQLMKTFNNPDVQDGVVEPIAWKDRFVDFKSRMDNLTREKSISIPQNFAYGFDDYVGSIPRDKRHTLLLGRQLSVIELILNKLVDLRVIEIKEVKRSVSEALYGMPPPESEQAGESPGRAATAPEEMPIVEAPDKVYREIPFKFVFTSDVSTLRNLLNFLAESRNVFVVRSLKVENSNPNIPGPEILGGATGAKAGPQIIYGNETVKVDLQVSLLEFKPLQAAQPAEEKKEQ